MGARVNRDTREEAQVKLRFSRDDLAAVALASAGYRGPTPDFSRDRFAAVALASAGIREPTRDEAQGGKGDENRLIVWLKRAWSQLKHRWSGSRLEHAWSRLNHWWSGSTLKHWWSGKRRDEPHVVLDDTGALKPITQSDVKAAAVGAALAHVLSRPDSIRQRAQNAATISSAVAAALLIAAVSQAAGGKVSFHSRTGVALGIALALWAASVAMSVYAVAFIDKGETPKKGYQPLVDSYEEYAIKARAKIRVAASLSGLALLATVGAMVLDIGELRESSPHDQKMELVVTKEGAAALTAVCSWVADPGSMRLVGKVVSTDQAFVQIKDVNLLTTTTASADKNPGLDCAGKEGVDVRVPRSAILFARNAE
jgi:hypothetical protein